MKVPSISKLSSQPPSLKTLFPNTHTSESHGYSFHSLFGEEMGSFIDLNLYPDPPPSTTTAAVAVGIPLIVPKIEPKLEPLDELLDVPPEEPPQPLQQQPPQPAALYNLNPSPNSQPPAAGGNDGTNVYSEFSRISEMFRTAFSQGMEQFEGLDVLDSFSGAIVPVPDENQSQNQLATVTVSSRRKYQQRSSELVRATDLGIEDEQYFRDLIRKTRMIYDSLRVFAAMEDDKRRLLRPEGKQHRARVDLKAATVMKQRERWLNQDKRIVGPIPGVQIGDVFFFRMEMCVIGLHGQIQAGIDFLSSTQSSNGEPIATSIIFSGGYEDDEDGGDVIIYTGHGGQDKNSKHVVHQKLSGGNLGMERSMHYGIEVRVIRGFQYDGSPSNKVYVYDGLYKIVNCWFDVGKSGFGVYKFKLVRMEDQPEMGSTLLRLAEKLRASPLEARPVGYVSWDISAKKEKMQVFLFNDIDNNHEPLYFEYLVTSVFPPYVYHVGGKGTGCDCVSGCLEGCLCAMKNGGEIAYDQNGLLVRGKPLIFECGPQCRCPPNCRNRVCQNGVKNRFEVFRSRETGWGVRSLDLIPAGSFLCEYTGVVITREQAQVFTMNGDTLVYPNRFGERWAEWGDLSQIFTDYKRPAYPSIPPLDFAMDVSRMRNVACYMSHSSCPNVLVQLVLYDHNNLSFPHLMLFAMENIPPFRELSLDYGAADEWTEKLAICN